MGPGTCPLQRQGATGSAAVPPSQAALASAPPAEGRGRPPGDLLGIHYGPFPSVLPFDLPAGGHGLSSWCPPSLPLTAAVCALADEPVCSLGRPSPAQREEEGNQTVAPEPGAHPAELCWPKASWDPCPPGLTSISVVTRSPDSPGWAKQRGEEDPGCRSHTREFCGCSRVPRERTACRQL